MTLVLSVLTDSWAIQVSDRRVAYVRSGRIVREDDESNKAIVYRNRLALAFTGLGGLGEHRRTDLWTALTLSRFESAAPSAATLGEAFTFLADAATNEFRTCDWIRRLPVADRRHAFIGIGWAQFNLPSSREYSAFLLRISNFHGPDGRELAAAEPTFGCHVERRPESDGVVFAAGQPLPPEAWDAMTSSLPEHSSDPLRCIAILGEAVRATAGASRFVGRGFLANLLPRGVTTRDATEWRSFGGLSDMHPTSLYYPPGVHKGVWHGPTIIAPGGIVIDSQTLEEA